MLLRLNMLVSLFVGLMFIFNSAVNGDDFLSSLDFARDSLMRYSAGSARQVDVLTPVRPPPGNRVQRPVPGKKRPAGAGVSERKTTVKGLSLSKVVPLPVTPPPTNPQTETPGVKRQRKVYKPRASPSNKFLEALNEIERAVANARLDTSLLRNFSPQKLQQLAALIKKAADYRSYRYARAVLGQALYLIKQQQRRSTGGRTKRTSQNSASQFLDNLKLQLGDDKFNTFMAVQGDVTLMFTIDDTGSMGGEIQQAKEIAIDVINFEREAPVDYILSPFNDPEPEPSRAVYNDETEQVQFVQAINSLQAHSGGDCPEYAFKGILQAIYEGPRWGSPMYVFTDAYPKDATEENIDEVEALAADYGITINFFTTGECKRLAVHPAYSAVVAATNGQVFPLSNELELGQLNGLTGSVLGGSNSISIGSNISTRKRRRVPLLKFPERSPPSLSHDRRPEMESAPGGLAAGGSQHRIVVDESIEELTIALTASHPDRATLVDPNGANVTSGKISLSKATVYQISNPQVGAWALVVPNSAGSYEFRVKSTSPTNIDFEHFFLFTPRRGRQKNIPIRNPLLGEQARAVLTVAGVDKVVPSSLSVELITEHGEHIADVGITSRGSGAHFMASFRLPNQPFKIKLKGNTRGGNPFERISRNVVKPKAGVLRTRRASNDFTLPVGRESRVTLELYSALPTTTSFNITARDSLGYFVGLTRSINVRARPRSPVLTSVRLRATRSGDVGKTDILFVRATAQHVSLSHLVHLLVVE